MMSREWLITKRSWRGDPNPREPALLKCFSDAILAKSQKGPGAGFDPRRIKTSYARFLAILAGFHKRGTDPLGSIIRLVRRFSFFVVAIRRFQQRLKARAAPLRLGEEVARIHFEGVADFANSRAGRISSASASKRGSPRKSSSKGSTLMV